MDFKTAVESDLTRLGLSERQLAERIGVSQQACGKWAARGFPPLPRVRQYIEALGADSAVAAITPEQWLEFAQNHKARLAAERVEVDEDPAVAAARPAARRSADRPAKAATVIIDVMEEADPRAVPAKLLSLAAARVTNRLADGSTVALAVLTADAVEAMGPDFEQTTAHARALGVEIWLCSDGLELARRMASRQGATLQIG